MPSEREPMTMQANAGQEVVVELPASPGAGAVWVAPPGQADCTVTRLETRHDGSGIGGQAVQRFAVSCRSVGEVRLRFELKRPWENTVRAVQPVDIKVR